MQTIATNDSGKRWLRVFVFVGTRTTGVSPVDILNGQDTRSSSMVVLQVPLLSETSPLCPRNDRCRRAHEQKRCPYLHHEIDTPKLLASILSVLNATFAETSASRRFASGSEGN